MFTPQIETVIKKVDQLRQTTDDWPAPRKLIQTL